MMSRFLALLTCLILMLSLCLGVSAADNNRAYSVNVFATVSADGSCDVASTVTLHVDSPQKNLTYPVPADASNITLNGSPVLTEKSDQIRLVNLSKILGDMSGDFSFTVGYSLHSVVEPIADSDRLQLELPMLSGFTCPIDELQFSVNLPGAIDQDPQFISGYHQANIEKDLTYSVSGSNIAGRSWTSLKDHETLILRLSATEELFPQSRVELPEAEGIPVLIWICAGLALIYWLLCLRNFLPLWGFPAVAPEGFGAGQMGTILTKSGADLSLMAFSWAQLGYVVLQMDRRGKVIIRKQMEMGNERTAFEQKCFQKLFARKDTVDTSSPFFRKLSQIVVAQNSAPELLKGKHGGNVTIFRILMALAGLFSGAYFGIVLGNLLDYGWVFMLVLSCLGLIGSWHIQTWPQGVFLHHRIRLYTAVIMSLMWLVLGTVLGQCGLALATVLLQVAAGLFASFGGRRTEEGRFTMGQVLRLRHHFITLSAGEVRQLSHENPEFFFDMAPYALALGCDGAFARKLGKSRLPVCPYIVAGNTRGLTAKQWSQLMRSMLESMSAPRKERPMSGLRSVMDNYMK